MQTQTEPSAFSKMMGLAPTNRRGLPVATGALPVFGHSYKLFTGSLDFIRGLQAQHDSMCWIKVHPAGWEVMLLEPKGFELLRKRFATVSHYTDLAGILLGYSLLTRDGEEHRSVRGALHRSFTPKGLSGAEVGKVMAEVVKTRVDRMVETGKIVALSQTRDLALDIVFRILGISDEDVPEWRRHYEEVTLSLFPLKAELPGLPAYKARKGREWVEERIMGLVEEIRGDDTRTGLMAEMVRDWDQQDPRPPDGWLVDNILLLALAGHETTASTMAWMMAYLARDPALWAQVANEARAVGHIPQAPGELSQFPIAESVFREALRLYPPVPVVSRRLSEDAEVMGTVLPAGTSVSVPIMAFGRDPQLYPDPDSFKPERWQGMDRRLTPAEMLPFSYGPHFCLGYHVAWMEAVQLAVGLGLKLGPDAPPRQEGGFPGARMIGLCQPVKGDTVMTLG